jgi:hypothetical protein
MAPPPTRWKNMGTTTSNTSNDNDSTARLSEAGEIGAGKPECLSCKIDKERSQRPQVQAAAPRGDNDACSETYRLVERCMLDNGNQVRECQIEWRDFQKCMRQRKAAMV